MGIVPERLIEFDDSSGVQLGKLLDKRERRRSDDDKD